MNPRTLAALFVLTLSAGYADAVAFFGLGTFTANMTGNTVLVGAALAGFALKSIPAGGGALAAFSVGWFAAGAIALSLASRTLADQGRVRAAAVILGTVLLLAAASLFHRDGLAAAWPCVALLSAVMGMQSVVAVGMGVPGVSTVYVTGTIVTALRALTGAEPTATPAEGVVNLATWALYLGGAVAGAIALHALGRDALWPVAGAIALLVPLAIRPRAVAP